MNQNGNAILFRTAAILTITACSSADITTSTAPGDETIATVEQREAWDSSNNPRIVIDANYVINLSSLPRAATTRKPIPGDYWPASEDSINRRWDGAGSMAPTEKYARLFGRNDLMNVVSTAYGIKNSTFPSPIPSWFGICNGWAAYAISEPQPTSPVARRASDGTLVTFYPGDIEALMSYAYLTAPVKFISSRCSSSSVSVDSADRMALAQCRDMNPGTLHAVLANRLGLEKKGLVFDRYALDQVWNQPTFAYEIHRLDEVTSAQAAGLVNGGSFYTYNSNAKRFFHVENAVSWVREASPSQFPHDPASYTETTTYEYVLETDAASNIVGGEWIGDSKAHHPDFAWYPTQSPDSAADGLIQYAEVKALNDQAAMPRPDFNNDGSADILWHNVTSGTLSQWYMNGITKGTDGAIVDAAGNAVAVISRESGWTVLGLADFNRDGQTDILWQNLRTGVLSYWYMNGIAKIADGAILDTAGITVAIGEGSGWQMVGLADLNRDGHTDILWHNAITGVLSYWYMNGTTKGVDGAVVDSTGSEVNVKGEWQARGVADLNHDGYSDLLWQNISTGVLSYWYMNGTTKGVDGALVDAPLVVPSSGWRLVGASDLSGDGSPDLLWTNVTSGVLSYWYLDGITKVAEGALANAPNVPSSSGWEVVSR